MNKIVQRNNVLVWDETVRIMNDLFDNVWGDRSEVVVDHCVDITLPVRFLLLRLGPFFNITPRLRSSSSVSQVVYTRPGRYSLMTTDTRVWPSGLMDQ